MREELARGGDPEGIGGVLLAGDQRRRHRVEVQRGAGLEEGRPARRAVVEGIEQDVPALVEEGFGIAPHLVVDDAMLAPAADLLDQLRDQHRLARARGAGDDRVVPLGALRPGDAGDQVGLGLRGAVPQQQPAPPWQGASPQLLRACQLAAPQALAAPQPSPQQAQPEQDGDGEACTGAAAEQGGIDGVLEQALAKIEDLRVCRDGVEGHDEDRAVHVAHLLGLVGLEVGNEHELAQRVDAEDVPVMVGVVAGGLPDGGAQARDDDGDADPPAEPEPGAEAPGSNPEPAPGIAAHTGHCETSASAAAPGASAGPLPVITSAASAAEEPARSLKRASQRSAAGLGRHGPDGAAQRREGGPGAAHAYVASLRGIRHEGDEAQHIAPVFRQLRVEACGLAHGPVDSSAVRLCTRRRPRRCGMFSVLVAEPGGARRNQECVECKGAAVFIADALQRLDLLRHRERMLGEGEKTPRPPAPAAGVGQHTGDRLEIHVDILALRRISGPAGRRRLVRCRAPAAPGRHVLLGHRYGPREVPWAVLLSVGGCRWALAGASGGSQRRKPAVRDPTPMRSL